MRTHTVQMGNYARRRRAKRMEREAAEADDDATVFDLIMDGTVHANIIYEDEVCIAFFDSLPVAPVHILVVPKSRDGLISLAGSEEQHKLLLGHLMWAAGQVAAQVGIAEKGFRTIVNSGRDAGQTIEHLHLHVLGGRQMSWPPDNSMCAHLLWGVNRLLRCAGLSQRCVLGRQASAGGFDTCESEQCRALAEPERGERE